MKKRMIALFLLITCLMLTGCSNATTTPETEEPQTTASEEKLYMYSVGGTVLYLHTRVEDYLSDTGGEYYNWETESGEDCGIIRYDDLTRDLGWRKREDDPWKDSALREYDVGDETVFTNLSYNGISGDNIPGVEIVDSIHFGLTSKKTDHWSYSQLCIMYVDTDSLEGETIYLTDGKTRGAMFFNQVVVLTYVLENYPIHRGEGFFTGLFDEISPNQWYVYEN